MNDFVLLKLGSGVIVGLNQTLMVLGHFEALPMTLLFILGTACLLEAFS